VSLDDLNDLATFKIENADEYAMTLSPDKTVIYLAAAKVILEGRLMVLDSHTLDLQRTFGRISWGAIMLAASPRFNMLALHGRSGIDFYDIKEGDRLYHVSTSFPVVGGRFLGGATDSEYMAYGSDGSIRRWTPELGTETGAYMTIDGGSIQRLDKLPDGSGFLSISDRPSITNWAFDTRGVSTEYSTPLVIRGDNMGFPRPLSGFDFSAKQNAVVAAYSGNLVQRWNLNDGTMTVVKAVEPTVTDAIEKVTGLANGMAVLSHASGAVDVYSASAGPDHAAGTIKSEPLAYLAPIADTQAFFVDKSGRAGRIDVSDAATPKIEMLPALAQCAGEVSTSGFAVCVDKDGKTRVLRNADSKLLADLPAPAGGLASAFMSDDGTRLAVGGWAGDIDIRALPEDKSVKTMTLSTNLSGRRLLAAVQSGKMSAADLAAIRGGASKLDVTLGANTVALSEDQVHFAAGMPYGVLKVFNLQTGSSRDLFPNAANAFIEQMAFSPHGRLIAAIERSEYRVLAIYDVEDGSRLARISLSNQAAPKLFALTNGRGFVTIDNGGRIVVHPVFEKTDDFIGYLSKEFPQPLTPAQKRAFFID
jgi:WD40 repeat protein